MIVGVGIGVGFLPGTGAGAGAAAPATPTLTAPADGATLFNDASYTVSATTTDGDLDRIDWVLDPGGGETVIATDASSPYSQAWALSAITLGAHTLVARAVRGGLSTDSASIDLTVADRHWVRERFFTNGTLTTPANFLGPSNVVGQARVSCLAAGGGGSTGVGGGGGGERRSSILSLAASTGYAVAVGTSAADTDGGPTTFNATSVVANGGKSGTNGGTGGTGGTGTEGFNGGNGVLAAGNAAGGGSAGDAEAGSGVNPGEPNGGRGGAAGAVGIGQGSGGGSTAGAQASGNAGRCTVAYQIPATAGSPRVDAEPTVGRDTSNQTTRNITLPGGSGGVLHCAVSCDGNPTVTMTGWAAIATVANGANNNLTWFYRTATGSDPVAIDTSASEELSWYCFRVVGGGTPEWTTTTGNSAAANSPNHNHGSSVAGLWVSVVGIDGNTVGITASASPTNYTGVRVLSQCTGSGAPLLIAYRTLTASAEDPGAWTNVNDTWVAATVLIPPA